MEIILKFEKNTQIDLIHIAGNPWLIMLVYSPLITCGSIGSSRSCLVTDPAFTRCYSNITLRKFYNWSVGNKISFNAKKTMFLRLLSK